MCTWLTGFITFGFISGTTASTTEGDATAIFVFLQMLAVSLFMIGLSFAMVARWITLSSDIKLETLVPVMLGMGGVCAMGGLGVIIWIFPVSHQSY